MSQNQYFFKLMTVIDGEQSYNIQAKFPKWNIMQDCQHSHEEVLEWLTHDFLKYIIKDHYEPK
jgi:hypothetical protein